jgi:serine/threonine-protein kinase
MRSSCNQQLIHSCDRETVTQVTASTSRKAEPEMLPVLGRNEPSFSGPWQRPRPYTSRLVLLIGCGTLLLANIVGAFGDAPQDPRFLSFHVLCTLLVTVSLLLPRRRAQQQLGQYRLISRLGAGGMGEVYLAEHCMLGRRCAIKVIRPEQAGDARVLARFEREVRMTARLSHWNTIEIFDFGRTEDGALYYAMEYLPGLSLENIIEQHGPMPAERVIHLLRQICQSLREAHGLGLIHRDIKPANLFAAQRGGMYDVAKLLDFGLVKPTAEDASAHLTHDGAISGTPLFMSPEQASGTGNVDARSDIYSLGAVAYALLTGRPPFERESRMEVLVAHIREEATPPSQLEPDVPADLEHIVLRCLAKTPADRYQSAASLEEALACCEAADQWTQACAARWWQARREVA